MADLRAVETGASCLGSAVTLIPRPLFLRLGVGDLEVHLPGLGAGLRVLAFALACRRYRVQLTLETPLFPKLGEGELEAHLLSWARGWGEG